jgi:AraC family cel operon transcriptional repressor
MSALKIYKDDIIDPESEIHYAIHRSLKNITAKHHHDFYELFLISKGKVTHIVNNVSIILEEGSLVFIRPDDVHYYRKYENSECEILNLAFPKKTIQELINYLGEGFNSGALLASKEPPLALLTKDEKDFVKRKIEGLNLIPMEKKALKRTALRITLSEILTKYFTHTGADEKSSAPEWLEIIKTEMQRRENFSKGFGAMAELAKRSKEHLCREFKKHYNMTPTEYINDLRLNYSANLLTTTDESILYISMEAGFENLSHFYHLFKNKYKVSPSQFRKLKKKSVIPT